MITFYILLIGFALGEAWGLLVPRLAKWAAQFPRRSGTR